MAFSFNLKKKKQDIWEALTPQNENALRAAQSSIADANAKINARGNNAFGVLANPATRNAFTGAQAKGNNFNLLKEGAASFANSLFNNSAKIANTTAAAARDIAPTARVTAALLTNNQQALTNANRNALDVRNKSFDGGLFGAGTIVDRDNTNFGTALKKGALTGVGAGAEIVPVVKPIVGAKLGLKSKIAANAAYAGTANAAASAGQQYADTGRISAKDTALAGGTGAILGPIGLGGRATVKVAPAVARDVGARADALDQRVFSTPERTNLHQQYQKAFDVETNPVRRRQINEKLAELNTESGFARIRREAQSPQAESTAPVRISTRTDQPQTVRLAKQDTPQDTPFNTQNYITERVRAQEAARKSEGSQGIRAKLDNKRSTFKARYIDSLSPIEDVVNKATNGQRDLTPDQRLTPQLDRALRTETIGEQYRVDNGLNDIIKNTRDPNALGQYLIAKRSLDIGEDINTGRNLDADRQLVNNLQDEFEPQAQQVRQYQNGLLDTAVSYGLMSPERAAQLKTENPNYIPFERIFNDEELDAVYKGAGKGNASISTQTIDQKIKGSNREIEDPLESLVKRTQRVIEQGERNKAANMLISYKDLPDNPFQLRQLDPDETVGSKPVISAFDNGRQIRYETTPEIAAAAKSLNTHQLGVIEKFLNFGTRLLRLGATSANAAFSLANLAADTGGAFINSRDPLTSILNPKVIGFALSATFNQSKGAAYAELRRQAAGGTSFDIARGAKPNSVKRIRSERNLATKGLYTVTNPSELLRVVEDTIGRTEVFTRAAQYKGGKIGAKRRNPGYTDNQASIEGAMAARVNSANFSRSGEVGRVLNSVLPYLNAGLQSARSFNNAVRRRPVQTLAKVGAIGLLPTATTIAWNVSDPERKAIYDKLQGYEKDNNFVIILPGAKIENGRAQGIIKVPSPFVIRGFQRAIREQIDGNPGESENLLKSLTTGTAQATTSLNVGDPGKLAAQVVPQGIKPAAEAILNRNFYTGEQIVPDAIKNLDAKDQSNKGTSGTAKVLGQLTNTSPLKIDNTIRTATGGVGQNIINTSDTLLAKTGAIGQDEIKGKSVGGSIAARFNSAAAVSDGAQYFTTLQKKAKDNKLAGSDLDQLNSITSKALDTNGQPRLLNDNDDLERSQILRSSPNVRKVLADTAKEVSDKTKTPLDPLYKLSDQEQYQYYDLKSLPYKGEDYQLALKKMPWYDKFQERRSSYFDRLESLKASSSPTGDTGTAGASTQSKTDKVKFPTFSDKQQRLLDRASELDGADRAKFIQANPDVQSAYDSLSSYTNEKRTATGRLALKAYPKADRATNAIIDEYNALPKADGKNGGNATRNAWVKANPDKYAKMQDYFAKSSEWTLANNAGLAKFEGEELNQKALGATYSLGNYSIAKQDNADGTKTYSIDPQQASADKQTKFTARSGSGGGGRRSGGRSSRIKRVSVRGGGGRRSAGKVRIKKATKPKAVRVKRNNGKVRVRKT